MRFADGREESHSKGMSHTCDHDTAPKPSKRTVAAVLKTAETRSLEAGLRFTPLRKRVLELLVGAGRPVKAYDLIGQLKSGAATAPPTIYRTLEALEAMGLAHRIASLNAYVACGNGGEHHAAWFLICDCCGSAEEIARPSIQALEPIQQQNDFQIQALEAHGRCAICRA